MKNGVIVIGGVFYLGIDFGSTYCDLFCSKCSLKFGSSPAKFNTSFAYDLHLSTAHKNETNVSIPHKERKSLECEICGVRFTRELKMNKHLVLVHGQEKPFKCERCDYNCIQKQSMNQHVVSVHEKKKPFKCKTCDRTFSHKSSMIRHVALVHEGM